MSKAKMFAVLVVAALLVAGCGPDGLHLDPCRPQACGVPVPAPSGDPVAEYVPLCETVGDAGPCVTRDDTTVLNAWWLVGAGGRYPEDRQGIVGCVVETGGPVPCVWVPSAMGEYPNPGDAGAYVYLGVYR